jgi:predicted HAD superfamily Cof-like phosphohydrolase
MTDFVDGVLELNRGAGRPEVFTPRMVAFHTGLQLEELAEKLEAVAEGAFKETLRLHAWHLTHMIKEMNALGNEFKRGMYDELVEHGNRKEMMDADVDLQVVTLGGMMTAGNDIRGALGEVNRSNLDKKFPDGTYHLDPNGKIIKPEGWKKPDLTPFVVKS